MLKDHKKQFHIGVGEGEIGEYCILPGDPARCEKIAAYFDEPYFVGQNREYNIWNGKLAGKTVTACSTGIGGPSTAIAAEELFAAGAKVLIRVGTCGGIDLDHVLKEGTAMQIDLTNKEFRYLLDLVYIGNWVLNSIRGDNRFADYDAVESKLFGLCRNTRLQSLVESWRESWTIKKAEC